MGQVTIDINGRHYGIACDDGEENHIATLGQNLADRVKQLADAVGQVGDARLLVMAGLLLTDELMQAKSASGETVEPVAADDGEAARRLEELAGRIESIARQAEQVADRIDHT